MSRVIAEEVSSVLKEIKEAEKKVEYWRAAIVTSTANLAFLGAQHTKAKNKVKGCEDRLERILS